MWWSESLQHAKVKVAIVNKGASVFNVAPNVLYKVEQYYSADDTFDVTVDKKLDLITEHGHFYDHRTNVLKATTVESGILKGITMLMYLTHLYIPEIMCD